MNKKVKQKWIAALESGDYKQGKNFLKNKNKFCCLGVLCDLYAKETGKGKWNNRNRFTDEKDDIGDSQTLTLGVMEWAGLDEANPSFKLDDDITSLANENDKGRSFKHIAVLIEENL